MAVDALHVVRRLTELRDWAEYVHESLVRDQPYEEGKLQALLELAPANELEELRASSFFLARRLNALLVSIGRPDRDPAVTARASRSGRPATE